MKLNTGKCRLLIYRHICEQVWMDIGGDGIQEASNVELLRILIENRWNSIAMSLISVPKPKIN